MDINEDLPNEVAKEPILSINTKLLLSKLGICTFRGLSRMKTGTFLKKAPKITTQALYSIEECLSHRKLSFISDDTISSFEDPSISQRKLRQLWSLGVVRYKDLNQFHYWELTKILGKTVFGTEGTYPWMKERGVVPSGGFEFYNVGFSEGTLNKLMLNEIVTFKKIESMNEWEMICVLSKTFPTKWPSPGSSIAARLREIKYILWKNGKNFASMNKLK